MTRIALLAVIGFAAFACTPVVGPPVLQPAEGQRTLPQPYVETTTADGEVVGVDRSSPGQELAEGLTIRMRADDSDPIDVKLAPGWFLEENGIAYGPAERLRVRGRATREDGRSVLIATEVRHGERWVPLRDAQGHPLWRNQSEEPQPRD